MTSAKFLIRLLLALSLGFVSVSFVSCSDDDSEIVVPGGEEPSTPEDDPEVEPDESESKAGDDFYMYVNGEWHESLANADKSKLYGYTVDVDNAIAKNLIDVKTAMKEYESLKKALANHNKEKSIKHLEKVAKELLGGIKTKKDAFVAYGRGIRMGLTSLGELHAGIADDSTIGYLFTTDDEDDEEESAHHRRGLTSDVISTKTYKRAIGTRAGSTAEEYIVQGLGLDKEHYLHNEKNDEFLAALEKMPLKNLMEILENSVMSYMMLYCDDEFVKEVTEGSLSSVKDYVNSTIEEDLGYFTSYYFTQKYITEDLKTYFRNFGNELKASFRNRIENNSWLSSSTKEAAKEKLDAMTLHYGSPDKWLSVEAPSLKGEVMLEDVLTIKESRVKLIEDILGKNVIEYMLIYYMLYEEITLYPYINNAFYNTDVNSCYIMAPYMIEPTYRKDMPDAELYAVIGATIGHEITHGFDRDGAKYDKYGKENNWWTSTDLAKFEELNNRMADQISTFEVIPGVKADGQKTVEEDVADLGGFLIAYDLYVKKLEEKGLTGKELIAEKKKYFIAYATANRALYPTDFIMEELLPDVHSINHIRVNGVVQHVDEWYELFNVTEDKALYLAPEKRVKIW